MSHGSMEEERVRGPGDCGKMKIISFNLISGIASVSLLNFDLTIFHLMLIPSETVAFFNVIMSFIQLWKKGKRKGTNKRKKRVKDN
jgi:hypothetical protein